MPLLALEHTSGLNYFTSHHSSQYVKSRFRALKHDLAWLVNAFLHHVFIAKVNKGQQTSGEGEGDHSDVDAFITTVTTILPEKL